jgi:hypothetical protein
LGIPEDSRYGGVLFFWKISVSENSLKGALRAFSSGWLGFGRSSVNGTGPNQMVLADTVIGYFVGANYSVADYWNQDRLICTFGGVCPDTQRIPQGINNVVGNFSADGTGIRTMQFQRPLQTGLYY